MRRSEICRVQCFARGRNVELDGIEAAFYVQSREILAAPDKYSQRVQQAARNVIECFDKALANGEQPCCFDTLNLPLYDDNDPRGVILEDVDSSTLSKAEVRLLHLPNLSKEDWQKETDEHGHWRRIP